MARSGSYPYVVVTAILTLPAMGALWGIAETEIVRFVMNQPLWDGSPTADLARQWMSDAWDSFLLIILLGTGEQLLIASRLRVSTTNLFVRSFFLYVFYLFMVFWSFIFPKVISETIAITNKGFVSDALTAAGLNYALDFLIDMTFVYGPALLLFSATAYYLFAPIKDDVFGGVAG